MGHAAFPAQDELRSLKDALEAHGSTTQVQSLDAAIQEVEKL